MVTTAKINKLKLIENTYKEEIILEWTQVFNEDMNPTNNTVNKFGILVASKKKKRKKKKHALRN